MLKLGIVGEGNDGIAPLTGCPVEPTSKLDQYTTITLLLLQYGLLSRISVRDRSSRAHVHTLLLFLPHVNRFFNRLTRIYR